MNADVQQDNGSATSFNQNPSAVEFKSSTFHNNVNEASYLEKLPYLGKLFYKSLSSVMNEEKYLPKTSTSSASSIQAPPPPLWKILSSALKLLGLAGFWAGDNIAYLYSIGFLMGDDADITKKRKNNAALFATRSYFFAAVAGLYLNSREWFRHRNGPIKQLMEDISKLKMKQSKNKSNKYSSDDAKCGYSGDSNHNDSVAEELEKLETKLEQLKQKHFKVCLALLKVSCVLSLNPFFTKMYNFKRN